MSKTIMNRSVLLLDDDQDFLATLSLTLRNHGLDVHEASQPEAALQWVRTDHVGVAVLDVMGVDGLNTAKRILDIRENIRVVFLSAFLSPESLDSEQIRRDAAQIGIAPWAWIDKNQAFQERTLTAIAGALGIDYSVQLNMRLMAAAAEIGLEPDVSARLIRKFDSASIVPPPAVEVEAFRPPPTAPPTHEQVLQQLSIYLEEARLGYEDLALRRNSWDAFVALTMNGLWLSLSEDAERHRRQMVVQLQQATRLIHPDQLEQRHIEAAQFTLRCLRNGTVTRAEVTSCKRRWREFEIETLPSLAPLVDRWSELYPSHDVLESDDNEPAPGNDDPTEATRSQSGGPASN